MGSLGEFDLCICAFWWAKWRGAEGEYHLEPTGLGLVIRALLFVGAGCAAGRWRVPRIVGFAVLWWIPCLFATVYVHAFGVPLPRGNEHALAVIAVMAIVEAVLISVWVQPWVGRLFLGRSPSKAEPPSSRAA